MKLLFISGGSGGHLSPLVAVAHALKEVQPSAEVMMACSDRPDDARYLSAEGFAPALTLPRPRRNFMLPFTLLKDIQRAKEFLKNEKPDVIFAKGAAVSVPLCYAAHRLKIPIVVHESDAVMGNANRIIARWAKVVCLGFPRKQKSEIRNPNDETNMNVLGIENSKFGFASNLELRTSNLVVTGNPLRPHIADGKRDEGLRITGFSGKKPILLVVGGSQGAQAINDAVIKHLEKILAICDVVHLTGAGKKHAITMPGYWSAEFVYDELPHLYAAASFALSRAGAGTMSELAANGVPTIYVPIRGLAHDHQMANATRAQENGIGILLLQSELDEKLFDVVQKFSNDAAHLQKISTAARAFQTTSGARRIAEIIVQCVA